MKSSRISPLLVILAFGALFWGGVAVAVWYWSSVPISSISTSIEGNIDAKANVVPSSTWIDPTTKAAYVDFVTTDVLFEGSTVGLEAGKQYLFLYVDDTNVLTLNLGLSVTVPSWMTVACDLQLESLMNDGSWSNTDMTIAADVDLSGATVYSLEWLGNPLFVPEYDNPLSQIFVVVEFDISVDPNAPVGSYRFIDLIIQLGDTP